MFDLAVTTLTAVAILGHSLLGCHAHHDHAAVTQPGEPAQTEQRPACCRRCNGSAEPEIPTVAFGHAPHQDVPCQEESCTFIKPSLGWELKRVADATWMPIVADSSTVASMQEVDGHWRRRCRSNSLPALPLRANSSVWLL